MRAERGRRRRSIWARAAALLLLTLAILGLPSGANAADDPVRTNHAMIAAAHPAAAEAGADPRREGIVLGH